jgi:hypothetical protein
MTYREWTIEKDYQNENSVFRFEDYDMGYIDEDYD